MLISDDEHDMLQALAEREGVTASDYIRLYIRREHAELAASSTLTDFEIEEKARRKYAKDAASLNRRSVDQPGDVVVDRGRSLVVLSNVNGELATYSFNIAGGKRLTLSEVRAKAPSKATRAKAPKRRK